MDIRDFQDDNIPNGSLGDIFNLQKELLDDYIKIEGIPQYPININTKSSQALIKDFIARVVEELGEAWESYLALMEGFHKGFPREVMIPHLQNFNEELADALHFHTELLIYSGISVNDIMYYNATYNIPTNYETLFASLQVGSKIHESNGLLYSIPAFSVIRDDENIPEFLRGGRKLSKRHQEIMGQYLWDITYKYQIARNTLKNKPWKQTQMLTDGELYKNYLLEAHQALFTFFWFIGMSPRSIFVIYYCKNQVNKFRIRSRY